MATQTMTYKNVDYHSPLKPLIFLAIIVLAASACAYGVHAVEKHGHDAAAVRHCLENNDPLQKWVKMTDGRVFLVCLLEDGRFGVQIRTEFEEREITSYIFRASKGVKVKLCQLEQYLRNVGALRVSP